MKRLLCIGLVVVLYFGLCGCQEKDDQPEALPRLSNDEMEIIWQEDVVYGTVVKILLPDVVELELETKRLIEQWGERVYIVTNQADEWCVGDDIEVEFRQAHRPHDKNQYVRIIADVINTYRPVLKPIIYFYPDTATECSAKVMLNGKLACTYPEHGLNGWEKFTAYPDGTLVFPDGKEYYALYWEGIQKAQWDFSTGYCVRGEDTTEFLEWALAEQGMTPREVNEFIIYWLPLMQDNPYNVISFQTKTYTDGAKLDITPVPDSILRVFMAYYPSDSAVEIEPQVFEQFERRGFTVVEWGGSPA